MLAYERHGSGEPLVLVHGVTHRRQAWYPVLDELAEQRDVILVDLPGHGDSPDLVLAGQPVEDVLRTEFQAFLAALGLDRPHVAGNSLGGLIALGAGAERDARSVTALSPAGFWRNGAQFAYTKAIFQQAAVAVDRLGPRARRLPESRTGRRLMYGLLTAHPARVGVEQARGDLAGFVRARPALPVLLDAARPFDRTVPADIPVTVAWAARDLVLPPYQAARARALLPAARHITLSGVGHVPMTDNPRLVAEVLLRGSAPVASVDPLTGQHARLRAARRPSRAATA